MERRRRELSSSVFEEDGDEYHIDDSNADGWWNSHSNLRHHGHRRTQQEQPQQSMQAPPPQQQQPPNQQQLGALYQGYGTHYVDLWVGTPPQRQTVVVDTGSSATSFPCSECLDCGRHTDPPFEESASSTFERLVCDEVGTKNGCHAGTCRKDEAIDAGGSGSCETELDFKEAGHRSAFEAEDVAYAAGPHDRAVNAADANAAADAAAAAAGDQTEPEDEDGDNPPDGSDPLRASDFAFPLVFGCETHVSGFFERQLAGGIMGMDRRAQSFWGQMRASQVITRASFSLCFVRQPLAAVAGTMAGAITLGGTDDRLHRTRMVFARTMGGSPSDPNGASFRVRVRKVYLRENGGRSAMYDASSTVHALNATEEELNGATGGFSIDTGTTDTYLTRAASDEFRRVWKEITGAEYRTFTNEPMRLTPDQLEKAPTIMLQMSPHEGGIGDEVQTRDPSSIPGLAGKFDMGMPNDIMLAIPASHYMARNDKDGTYTARVHLDRDDEEGSVLGANALVGHDVMFDVDHARIGFAESDCDYRGLVMPGGEGGEGEGEEGEGGATGSEEGEETEGDDVDLIPDSGDDDENEAFCSSLKCRGLVVLFLTIIFVVFFLFARKYTVSRTEGYSPRSRQKRAEDVGNFEMSTNGSNNGGTISTLSLPSSSMTSPRNNNGYSDEFDKFENGGGALVLAGGERGGYSDSKPPTSINSDIYSNDSDQNYSDNRPSSSRDLVVAESSSTSSRRGSSSDRDKQHISSDTSHRSRDSQRSARSRDSHRSSRSSRSYRETDDNNGSSNGSHRDRDNRDSTRDRGDNNRGYASDSSHRSRESYGDRSHHSRESHRSLRSSHSHRSHRSSSSRDREREYQQQQQPRGDRSQQSRESRGSSGSRESRRSTGSSSRSLTRDGSRSRSYYSDDRTGGGGQHGSERSSRRGSSSSGRSRRESYQDDYPDEIPLPPSIT